MLLNNDFLLDSAWARKLYHGYAENMPIIDYHCHLVPQEIYQNKGYENLAQVWLYDGGFGDHYKWRLMRANGTPEDVARAMVYLAEAEFVTGQNLPVNGGFVL